MIVNFKIWSMKIILFSPEWGRKNIVDNVLLREKHTHQRKDREILQNKAISTLVYRAQYFREEKTACEYFSISMGKYSQSVVVDFCSFDIYFVFLFFLVVFNW